MKNTHGFGPTASNWTKYASLAVAAIYCKLAASSNPSDTKIHAALSTQGSEVYTKAQTHTHTSLRTYSDRPRVLSRGGAEYCDSCILFNTSTMAMRLGRVELPLCAKVSLQGISFWVQFEIDTAKGTKMTNSIGVSG